MATAEQITVDSITYALRHLADTEIKKNSKLVATSGVVYNYIRKIMEELITVYLPKVLENSDYLVIGGTRYNSIESIIEALAGNGSDIPIKNSTKFFTAGGAYADKSGIPVQGSTKCFTAGGAYADKAYAPEENSTKCFTAGGAFADKTDIPAAEDTRCLTSGGAFADKSDVALQGSKKNFTSAGAFDYTINGISRSWLGKVYGSILGRQWYNVSALNNNSAMLDVVWVPEKNLYVAACTGESGDYKGCWYRQGAGGWIKGTGTGTTATVETIAYGNGMFVAGMYGLGLMYSNDGMHWDRLSTAEFSNYRFDKVLYANGLWVAGSKEHGLWWSEDGINWTQGTGCTTSSVTQLVTNGTVWMAGTSDHGLCISNDGKTWNYDATLGTNGVSVNALSYAKGYWHCALNAAGEFYFSNTNGAAWVKLQQNINANRALADTIIKDVRYGNGCWLAVGEYTYNGASIGYMFRSASDSIGDYFYELDENTHASVPFDKVFYANGIWCATASKANASGYLFVSTGNGVSDSWSNVRGLTGKVSCLYYGGGAWFLSTEDRKVVSSDFVSIGW